MLQRVMIAMAACMHPPLLIADEPTTALDVHTQKRVLQHLNQIRHDYGTAILLITHDLGVIAEMADQVVVMKQGEMVKRRKLRFLKTQTMIIQKTISSSSIHPSCLPDLR